MYIDIFNYYILLFGYRTIRPIKLINKLLIFSIYSNENHNFKEENIILRGIN